MFTEIANLHVFVCLGEKNAKHFYRVYSISKESKKCIGLNNFTVSQ